MPWGRSCGAPFESGARGGLADELQVDVFEAGADHLEPIGLPLRGEPGDEGAGLGRALLAGHAVLDPAHDRHARIRSAEFVDGAERHELAAGDDAAAVGELLGLVEVVGREQDARALVAQAADEGPELAACLGVEARGRLVEEQQLGASDDAEGDVDAALLAARELRDAGARLLLEADGGDHLVDVARVRVEPGEVTQLLAHGGGARLARRLQHDAEPRLPGEPAVLRVGAEHAHLAGAAVAVALEDLDGGGLAGAIRAEQGEGLSAADVEVEAAHGLDLPVALAQPPHLDDSLCGHTPTLAPRTPLHLSYPVGSPSPIRWTRALLLPPSRSNRRRNRASDAHNPALSVGCAVSR